MTRLRNPYIAGNPISDQDRFIGRSDILRETIRVLRNPSTNAIVLHGQRRIGKTSVLLRLQKDLTSREYCPVYFDLQDRASMALNEVLYQLAQTIATAAGMDLPARNCFDPEGNFFLREFLPSAVSQVEPRTLVFLFDEFDVLDLPQEGQAGSVFFPYMRTWMAQVRNIQFVFVLGRRPEELSTDTLATFKGTMSRRISLISHAETLDIIRLSEKNQSLYWSETALNQLWNWTQGHPYFTQLLCSEIWEAAYDTEPGELPTITAANVDNAIADALDQGANALQWIWSGLPPAERIVMAAMAEQKSETISHANLNELLNISGVRLILRELEVAPETMEKWDLLRRVDDNSNEDDIQYRFAIPLLKRWVTENKPLRLVKAELDSIEPLAMNLFQSAQGYYGLGNLDRTQQLLTNALDLNPNHMQSRLLLGRVQLGKGDPAAAVETLERAYEFDPPTARQDFIAALLADVENESNDDRRLTTYNRILEIEPDQPVAREARYSIMQQRSEKALQAGDYQTAIEAYRQLDDTEALNRVLALQNRAEVSRLLAAAEAHEESERWPEAVEIYTRLLAEFPYEDGWQERLGRASEEVHLATLYAQALGLIQEKKTGAVPGLLAQIISRRPDYRESARYLMVALLGEDIEDVKSELQTAREQNRLLQDELDSAGKQIRTGQDRIRMLEKRASSGTLAGARPPATAAGSTATGHGDSRPVSPSYSGAWISISLVWGLPAFLTLFGISTGMLMADDPNAAYKTAMVFLCTALLAGHFGQLERGERAIGFAVAFGFTAMLTVIGIAGIPYDDLGAAFTQAIVLNADHYRLIQEHQILFIGILACALFAIINTGMGVIITISVAFALSVIFAVAVADIIEGAKTLQYAIIVWTWVSFWLKLSGFGWGSSLCAGILAGLGTGGIGLVLTDAGIALVLGNTEFNTGIILITTICAVAALSTAAHRFLKKAQNPATANN